MTPNKYILASSNDDIPTFHLTITSMAYVYVHH